jgi:hypothetical protein
VTIAQKVLRELGGATIPVTTTALVLLLGDHKKGAVWTALLKLEKAGRVRRVRGMRDTVPARNRSERLMRCNGWLPAEENL